MHKHSEIDHAVSQFCFTKTDRRSSLDDNSTFDVRLALNNVMFVLPEKRAHVQVIILLGIVQRVVDVCIVYKSLIVCVACAYMGEVAACLACRADVAVPLSTVYTTTTASLIVASAL